MIPWESLVGGMLLGLAASLLLLLNGKVAGISGIISGLFKSDYFWRWMFVIGMVLGGSLGLFYFQAQIPMRYDSSNLVLIAAGLLVGIGAKLGNGCTSGHGVCGIGRFSVRSLVATAVFMLTAAITVFLRLHLL